MIRIIAAPRLDQALDIAADFLNPRFLGAERKSPSFVSVARLPHISKGRDVIRDRISFGVRLAISSAFGPGLRAQMRADRAFAQLTTEDFEVVRLVTLGDRIEVIFKRRFVEDVGCSVFGI